MAKEPDYMTQQDLLARIRADRAAFASLWHGLTKAQMAQRPGPQDDWSVKDLIAHIVHWEDFMMAGVQNLLQGGKSTPTGDLDTINAQVFARYKDHPLADVLAAFEANLRKLEQMIEPLDDEQINEAGHYQTYDGIALLPIIISDTFGHYAGHIDDLRAYVEKVRSGA